jgi:NTP pyrophosphatase (non-canonical NTP hydrolase)
MEIKINKGKYKIYHILGKKIGCTTNIKKRVEQEQGFKPGEYEILYETDDIGEASKAEKLLQKDLGYKEDLKLYKDLFKKNMSKHSSSEATTTYKVSVKNIDAKFLADMEIETPYGKFILDSQDKIDWVLSNVHQSQYGPLTCYTYNKAMSEAGAFQKYETKNNFDNIRSWANERGIIEKGDSKTQYIKLMEEAGELAEGLLKNNKDEIKDAIGDMIVVLTNLAALEGLAIEECIEHAYNEIRDRKGKMINGTFIKN